MELYKAKKEIDCGDAASVFTRLHDVKQRSFLLESKDVSHIYGRLSLLGVDPVLEIVAKNEKCEIKILNERGKDYLAEIRDEDLAICDSFERNEDEICAVIEKDKESLEESERTRRRNVTDVLRLFLKKFKRNEKDFLGLYGAFAYDFVRLFEDLPEILEDEGVADFRLCLYDSFVFFNHLQERAEVVTYRKNEKQAVKDAEYLAEMTKKEVGETAYKIEDADFDLSQEEFMSLVEEAQDLAKRGELFEVVYSNTLRANFSGNPFALYQKYREVNPSPYLFYFNFVDEQLVGASPEMMVRVEDGLVNIRPISGTARRGSDPIEDHENMLKLLASKKERSELDMLIDLGRNDLARICEPGVKISDYRFVEKYSKVMHTVAHVAGRLKKKYDSLDALIACLNAGTLTGAPKVAAMREIEKNENSRRGYYGGTIGYLTFSGEMDTGIIIRTAHIKEGKLSMRAGATLLYDSDPEAEYQEILNKAEAFLTTFKS